MELAGRKSQWGLVGSVDPIFCLTNSSRGNLEPAYYRWHLTNMEQRLITKQTPWEPLMEWCWREESEVLVYRLLFKLQKGFLLTLWDRRDEPCVAKPMHVRFASTERKAHIDGIIRASLAVCGDWCTCVEAFPWRKKLAKKCCMYFFLQSILKLRVIYICCKKK